jgi:hypothetical protein
MCVHAICMCVTQIYERILVCIEGPRSTRKPGGSGILTPLVIELCTIHGDMSQSSGTPRSDKKNACTGVVVLVDNCSTGVLASNRITRYK